MPYVNVEMVLNSHPLIYSFTLLPGRCSQKDACYCNCPPNTIKDNQVNSNQNVELDLREFAKNFLLNKFYMPSIYTEMRNL